MSVFSFKTARTAVAMIGTLYATDALMDFGLSAAVEHELIPTTTTAEGVKVAAVDGIHIGAASLAARTLVVGPVINTSISGVITAGGNLVTGRREEDDKGTAVAGGAAAGAGGVVLEGGADGAGSILGGVLGV